MRDGDRRKFVELASKRVSKALHDIQLIGNLSNRSNYHYTEEDVAKIFRALSAEIRASRKRFDLAMNSRGNNHFALEE
jgi:hypothetical protein